MTKKLIIIGSTVTGSAVLIAGITVPTVLVNQGNGSNSSTTKPQLSDVQKINDLKAEITKKLTEENKKITTSAEFVEYYNKLKTQLGQEQTSSNDVKFTLVELTVQNTSDIAKNNSMSIKYDFQSGETKDSLIFIFKNVESPEQPETGKTDQEKIKDVKDKFSQELLAANSQITDSSKFVKYYDELKSQLNKEQTSSNGVKFTLIELTVSDTSDIAKNESMTVKYSFKSGDVTDSLTFTFKNVINSGQPEQPNPEKPNPEKPEQPNPEQPKPEQPEQPGQPEQGQTDWQKVRTVKQKLYSEIKNSSTSSSFENLYQLYLKELNQNKTGEFNTNIKLTEFKAQYPKAEKPLINSYFSVIYEISFNGYSETLEYKFMNPNPIKSVIVLSSLTSYDHNLEVKNGTVVRDFRLKDATSKLDDLEFPDYIEQLDKETGITYRAPITGIKGELYKGRQIRTLKLPKYIRFVGTNSFSNNEISRLDFSNTTLDTIDAEAFRNNRIESVVFPKTLKQISWGAFASNKIKALDLSHTNVQSITPYSFEDNNIETVQFSTQTYEIRERAFHRNWLSTRTLNASNFSETRIRRIDPFAFAYQRYDWDYHIQIGEYPVKPEDIPSLIKLPSTLELLGRGAFEVTKRMPFYPNNTRTDFHSQMFIKGSDYQYYAKTVKILNENGTQTDFSNRYYRDFDYKTYFTGRGYFNAVVFNSKYHDFY